MPTAQQAADDIAGPSGLQNGTIIPISSVSQAVVPTDGNEALTTDSVLSATVSAQHQTHNINAPTNSSNSTLTTIFGANFVFNGTINVNCKLEYLNR